MEGACDVWLGGDGKKRVHVQLNVHFLWMTFKFTREKTWGTIFNTAWICCCRREKIRTLVNLFLLHFINKSIKKSHVSVVVKRGVL